MLPTSAMTGAFLVSVGMTSVYHPGSGFLHVSTGLSEAFSGENFRVQDGNMGLDLVSVAGVTISSHLES